MHHRCRQVALHVDVDIVGHVEDDADELQVHPTIQDAVDAVVSPVR